MSLPKARESLTRLATLQQATSLKLQQWQSEFKGASSPTYFREPSRPDDGEQVIRDLQQAIKDQEEIQDAAELEINQYCKSVLPSNDSTGLELQQQITVSKANFESLLASFRNTQLSFRRSVRNQTRNRNSAFLLEKIPGVEEQVSLNPKRQKFQAQSTDPRQQALLESSENVTRALQRTHQLMSAELSRSRFAADTLARSTKDLEQLSASYSRLDDLLIASRSLVTTLVHSSKSDTWYLETAFLVLGVTISWLLFRRILYGPGYWLLYWPISLFWRAIVFILGFGKGLPGNLNLTRVSVGPDIKTSLGLVHSTKLSPYGEVPLSTSWEDILAMPSASDAADISKSSSMDPKLSDDGLSDKEVHDDATRKEAATIVRERNADEPTNPKKRVWEEPS